MPGAPDSGNGERAAFRFEDAVIVRISGNAGSRVLGSIQAVAHHDAFADQLVAVAYWINTDYHGFD